MIQTTDFNCGPTSLHNALWLLGKRVPIRTVQKLCQTDPKLGTDEYKIINAITSLGYKSVIHNFTSFQEFEQSSSFSFPAICAVDNSSHWIVLLGMVGDRYIVLDSSNSQKNIKKNGIWSYSTKEWAKRWKDKKSKTFFAITLDISSVQT